MYFGYVEEVQRQAPVFTPTHDELQNFPAYLAKIRPAVEGLGICRIKPPKEWVYQCDADLENVKFVSGNSNICRDCELKSLFNEDESGHFTIDRFSQVSAKLKMDYFDRPADCVDGTVIESEFWRMQSSNDNTLSVCISSNLCNVMHQTKVASFSNDEEFRDRPHNILHYGDSGWNLHSLADHGILRHFPNLDDSSLKKPTFNLSMCFTCKCWQTDQHWGYVVNYLHWGEDKTWYAIKGADADKFEEDVLHTAVIQGSETKLQMINPKQLMANGFMVTKTVQLAGEFVVTLPRAYYSWISHGLSLAESVTFLPDDWLSTCLKCYNWSQMIQKPFMFSLTELLFHLLTHLKNPELLPLLQSVLCHLVEEDKAVHRHLLVDMNMKHSKHMKGFELLPAVKRRCEKCKIICFLFAVTCHCSPDRIVCCQHADQLCACSSSQHCLLYRYSNSNMTAMLEKLELKVKVYINWASRVKAALGHCDSHGGFKCDLLTLRNMVSEAGDYGFIASALYQDLVDAVEIATNYSTVAHQFLQSSAVCKRDDQVEQLGSEETMSLDEFKTFVCHVNELRCDIPEAFELNELLKAVNMFKEKVVTFLESEDLPTADQLAQLILESQSITFGLPECALLQQRQLQRQWFDEVSTALSNSECLTTEMLEQIIDKGASILPHSACEVTLHHLQDMLAKSLQLDDHAKQCLISKSNQRIAKSVLDEAVHIPVYLPNVIALRSAAAMASDWTTMVDKLLEGPQPPYVDVLESKVAEARTLPLHLDLLSQLESCISAAKSWCERTSKIFLKKHSVLSLLEVISPRTDIGGANSYKIKKRKDVDCSTIDTSAVMRLLSDVKVDFMPDLPTLVSAYQSDTSNEVKAMMMLRAHNMNRLADTASQRFCVCRQPYSENMLQCELCKDLFHGDCISFGKSTFKSNSSVLFSERFLCPICVRSRRPRLETVLSLLLSLQKLPARIAAGEILQLLAEHTMSWQDNARRFLAMDEVTTALSSIGEQQPENTDTVTTAEEIQHRLPSGLWQDSRKHSFDSESVASFEHAYSSMSKHNSSTPHQSVSVHRKSSCATAGGMSLPHELYVRLEHLMIEGDLLEVAVDETQHLWKLWKACHPSSSELPFSWMPGLKEDSLKVKVDLIEEQRKKKRKHLEVRSEDSRMELFVTQKKLKSDPYAKEYGKLLKDGSTHDGKKIKMMMKKGQRKQVSQSVDKHMSLMENNDEDCSAVKCLKPIGQEVDWVQCDSCQLWFHLVCIGLHKHDVTSDKDFLCEMCSNPQKSYVTPDSIVKLASRCAWDMKVTNESLSTVHTSISDTAHRQYTGMGNIPVSVGMMYLHSSTECECRTVATEVSCGQLSSANMMDSGSILTAVEEPHDQVLFMAHEHVEESEHLVDNEIVCSIDQVVYLENTEINLSSVASNGPQDNSHSNLLPQSKS